MKFTNNNNNKLSYMHDTLSLYSEVHKAQERSTGRYVALKKVRMENEKEGFPMTALREIRILQLLKHENVMELIEICRSRGMLIISLILNIIYYFQPHLIIRRVAVFI